MCPSACKGSVCACVCVCVCLIGIVYVCILLYLGKRQTVLFSATQTRNVDDLARVSLKKAPLYVGVDDHRDTATVEGLEQVSDVLAYKL